MPFPRQTVYLETSFFSFYHDERADPSVVAMRDWSREWWDTQRHGFDIVTSVAMLAELDQGSLPHRDRALEMALALPAIPIDESVEEIVGAYIRHKLMPNDPVGDPLHLALASIHKCDFLLTWNCRHLANARKFGHIRRVNALLGLHIPILTTPLELLDGGLTP